MPISIYIIILACLVNLDSLGIGITYGVRKIKIPFRIIVLVFFIALAMTSIGSWCGIILSEIVVAQVANYISAGTLFILSGIMIYDNFFKDKLVSKKRKKKKINFGILSHPEDSDIDCSSSIDFIEAVYLSLTLSIDASCVAFGTVVNFGDAILFSILTSIFQAGFLYVGFIFGERLQKISWINDKLFVVLCVMFLTGMAISHFL